MEPCSNFVKKRSSTVIIAIVIFMAAAVSAGLFIVGVPKAAIEDMAGETHFEYGD
jgi:flagellar basal body-associated protein FliL